MPRLLETEWPDYANSSGQPDNGTEVNAELLDAIEDAVSEAIYHPDHDEGPRDVIDEVAAARTTSYASLGARLDAIAVAAAGGAAAGVKTPVAVNLIRNGDFLLWSGGDSALPDYWSVSYNGAGAASFARIPVGTLTARGHGGMNALAVVTASGGTTDIYTDLIDDTDQSTDGKAPLKAAKLAGGVMIAAADASKVEVFIQDSNSSTQKVGKQGSQIDPTWVWSAGVDAALDGGAVLSSNPTRLRLIFRITGATTVYFQLATLGFGTYAPWPLPSDYAQGILAVGVGPEGEVATGDKAKVQLDVPSYVASLHGIATTAGACVASIAGCTATWNGGATAAVSYGQRSIAAGVLTFNVASAGTDIRGPVLTLRLLKPVQHLRALFGGN